jgi:glyoxylase-like metal-dependent hydrolase (beta-lactamase superfamily II)
MKKLFRRILYFLGVLILLILLFFISYFVRSRSAMRQMTPVETAQITNDIYALKDGYVNMYLIKDGSQFIAVDAGNNKRDIKDEMQKLGIDPDQVRAILLTHSDADHTGAISLFKDAKVYLPEDEEQLINGETGRFLFFGNKLDTKSYKLLDDEVIWIGSIKILPIPTPGHTPGSTCYVINDKYLFTGDAMSLQASGIDLFPKFINKNARRARKSMNKITDLEGVQYIFTAHYGYTDDYRTAVSQWKEQNQ